MDLPRGRGNEVRVICVLSYICLFTKLEASKECSPDAPGFEQTSALHKDKYGGKEQAVG